MSGVNGRASRVDILDAASVGAPQELANGFWKVTGRIARTGIQIYQDASGKSHRELRPAEEVFSKESLDSFSMMPVTNQHPPGLIDSQVARRYVVGSVGETVKRDGEFVAAPLMVYDAEAIATAKAGRQQLSCGYTCDLEESPGVWNGQPYDKIQRNIRGNHVALVDLGRAGPEARLRMDSADATIAVSGCTLATVDKEPKMPQQLTIDGMPLEVTEAMAPVIQRTHDKLVSKEKERADAAEKLVKELSAKVEELASVTAERDKLKTRVDGIEEEIKTAAAKLVSERSAIEAEARPHLGADADLSKLDNAGIRAEVIKKIAPDMKVDGLEPVAAYHAALAFKKAQPTAVDAARAGAATVHADAAKNDPQSARAKMLAANADAWKNKETK